VIAAVAAPAPAIATSMVAALVIAAVAAIIAGIVTLVALMRTGVDAIVTLVALLDILITGAVVAFHGTVIVLIASGGILAVIGWYGGGHRSSVVGDLASKRFRCHENAQQTDRAHYQQREFLHFYSDVGLPATVMAPGFIVPGTLRRH
jgi:hypothetical protein